MDPNDFFLIQELTGLMEQSSHPQQNAASITAIQPPTDVNLLRQQQQQNANAAFIHNSLLQQQQQLHEQNAALRLEQQQLQEQNAALRLQQQQMQYQQVAAAMQPPVNATLFHPQQQQNSAFPQNSLLQQQLHHQQHAALLRQQQLHHPQNAALLLQRQLQGQNADHATLLHPQQQQNAALFHNSYLQLQQHPTTTTHPPIDATLLQQLQPQNAALFHNSHLQLQQHPSTTIHPPIDAGVLQLQQLQQQNAAIQPPTDAGLLLHQPQMQQQYAAVLQHQQLVEQQQNQKDNLTPERQQHLRNFFNDQSQLIAALDDGASIKKSLLLPVNSVKKIMKADDDVSQVSAEAPPLLAKACELLVMELTMRSRFNAEDERGKKTLLRKSDVTKVLDSADRFSFMRNDDGTYGGGLRGAAGSDGGGPSGGADQQGGLDGKSSRSSDCDNEKSQNY